MLLFFQSSTALAIFILQNYLKDSTVDHCALLIEDNIGRPHLYELTPSGPKITPFVPRISSSLSDYIVQIPLNKSNVDEVTFRKQLFQHAMKSINNSKDRNEILEVFNHTSSRLTSSPSPSNESPVSPSVDFVLKAYEAAGLKFQVDNPKNISCTNLLENKYTLTTTLTRNKNEPQPSFEFHQSNVIRSLS